MTDSNFHELETAKLVENELPADEVPIYVRKHTPNPDPWGNWPIIVGAIFALVIGYCVVTTISETQKPAEARNGWMDWLVDYSVEKQKREGRTTDSSLIGPFSSR